MNFLKLIKQRYHVPLILIWFMKIVAKKKSFTITSTYYVFQKVYIYQMCGLIHVLDEFSP